VVLMMVLLYLDYGYMATNYGQLMPKIPG